MKIEDLSKEIIDFVIEIRGKYNKVFTPTTRLEKDLKITGDDGWEFMEAFALKFGVDLTDIDLSQYFAIENSLEMYGLVLFGIKTGKKELTLGHLEKAKKVGKLNEVIIN